MEIWKKKTTALICLAAMILGSTLIMTNVGLNRKIKEMETLFLVDEGDGFSIQSKLDSKMEFSNELANKFAIRFLDSGSAEIAAVNEAIAQLRNAEGVAEKAQASAALDQADNVLIGLLEAEEMSESEEKELRRFYTNLQDCNDKISHSTYNEQISEEAKQLSGFPASFFMNLFHLELPEQYR